MRAGPGNSGSRPRGLGKSPPRLRRQARTRAIPARAPSLARERRETAVSWPERRHPPGRLPPAERHPRRAISPHRPTSMASRPGRCRSDPWRPPALLLSLAGHRGLGANDARRASKSAGRRNVDEEPYGSGERRRRGHGPRRLEPTFRGQRPRRRFKTFGQRSSWYGSERQGTCRARDRRSRHEHRQRSHGNRLTRIRDQPRRCAHAIDRVGVKNARLAAQPVWPRVS